MSIAFNLDGERFSIFSALYGQLFDCKFLTTTRVKSNIDEIEQLTKFIKDQLGVKNTAVLSFTALSNKSHGCLIIDENKIFVIYPDNIKNIDGAEVCFGVCLPRNGYISEEEFSKVKKFLLGGYSKLVIYS